MRTAEQHVVDTLEGLEATRVGADAVLEVLRERGLDDADALALHAAGTLPDVVLAIATLLGDPAALRAFDRLLRRASEVAGGRTGVDASEIAQRLRVRLLVGVNERAGQLSTYDGRGSVTAWLRVCAFREALVLERSDRRTESVEPDAVSGIEPFFDPELRFLEADTNRLVKSAFRSAFADLPARDKVLLAYHYLDGHTMRTIGKTLGINASTVQRRLEAVREKLLAGTRRHFAPQANLAATGLEQAIGQLRSRLDLSISRLLRENRENEDLE